MSSLFAPPCIRKWYTTLRSSARFWFSVLSWSHTFNWDSNSCCSLVRRNCSESMSFWCRIYASCIHTHYVRQRSSHILNTQSLDKKNNRRVASIKSGSKKRGHHLIANILNFHDRIAWKLVNFCNIICWTQSLTFLLKNFIALWRHLTKTQLLSFIHIWQIDLSITQ